MAHPFKKQNERLPTEVREWLDSQDRSDYGFDSHGNPQLTYADELPGTFDGWDDPETGVPERVR
jgi:hypothetical protein